MLVEAMKKSAALMLVMLGTALPAGAQIATDIARGEAAYQASNVELAREIFTSVIASRQQVTTEQRVIAYKYLGAYWALQRSAGAADSSKQFFIAALDHDPFTDLDRVIFAADEQAAFARARQTIFKIGVEPIRPKALDTRSTRPDSSIYTFRVVSTHGATSRAEIRSLTNPNTPAEVLANISNHDGIREIPWNGLINTQRADTGLYEFVVVANDNVIRGNAPATERHRFRIEHYRAPLEDTLPSFRDVALGGTDTLKSRYSRALPYTDGAKGLFIGVLAVALPLTAYNSSQRDGMSSWGSHMAVGVSLGAIAGLGAGMYATSHRDDARAARENARRRNLRAEFNADVLARNRARIDRTILVIRPLTSAGTGN
jgi:hypothetical protein